MHNTPLISIVVPSFNQAQFLGETLQSLLDQGYPNLEVVIQEGGSKDGSIDIARGYAERHPDVFKLFVEKDSGQADALNRGFARVKGEILGFLNSDDVLTPGTLASVARHIDPEAGRFVVMGRSLFIGEGSRYVGVEHPAEYRGHFEHLAIWKRGFNTVPQPSVFWHRSVWERDGGFDVNEHHALDYDLFCRMSRHYFFHRVDELWSHYRMHDASKSAQRSEAEVLELSINVSRKYWGSWLTPLRWRCEISHWLHDRQLHEKARHHARRAEEAFKAGRRAEAFTEFARTALCSPVMARDRLFLAWLRQRKLDFLVRMFVKPVRFEGRYPDGWIGPRYIQAVDVPADAATVVASATFHPQPGYECVTVKMLVDGVERASGSYKAATAVVLQADATSCRGRRVIVALVCDAHFVPRVALGGEDNRALSLLLGAIEARAGSERSPG